MNVEKAKNLVEVAQQIAIIAHKSPDGDSIGSSLGLYNVLKELEKDVKVVMPDPHPKFLSWMKGADSIQNFEDSPNDVRNILLNADLIFCLDFNSPSRVGLLEETLVGAKAKKIMIDHHQDPENFVDIAFSFPDECSTCQLVYKFVKECEYLSSMTIEAGEALYCGMLTDTGSFKFPSTTSETHRIIADLMDFGVNHFKVHENVFDQNTLTKLRLRSHILNNSLKVLEDLETAILFVRKTELDEFNYIKGDTEGLVNVALSLNCVKRAVFFTEDDGYVKISFRSKGIENPVNTLANTYFNGGGHINAAGGRFQGSIEEAIEKFVTVLPEFV